MPTTKEPLTQQGIEDKLTALYALSNNDLRAQAIEIRDDFLNWMEDNFDLTTEQEDYLNGLAPDFAEFLADMSYITVKNRRPVDYTPLPPLLKLSKILEISNTFNATFDTTNGTIITGKLDVAADSTP